ncbi:hypothetical protein AZE42_11636 [Rhizopogon vesiculosus]|uniref:DUF6533 domain-containing protein n=1 Tax=Rhizopogon vesiculosus TaxID=180088 RepID=A0A1J8Q5E9_9AGAM|nr:hypothetical protein AZE42_11636 [Rhizopogon vesiculosus]
MTSKPLDGLRILNVIVDYRQRPTEYVRVAPIAVWVLEYFLNLDREVQLYTSMKRWSIPLTLFLLARYMPAVLTSVAIYNDLSPSVDANQCTINYTIVYTGFFLVMTASEGSFVVSPPTNHSPYAASQGCYSCALWRSGMIVDS